MSAINSSIKNSVIIQWLKKTSDQESSLFTELKPNTNHHIKSVVLLCENQNIFLQQSIEFFFKPPLKKDGEGREFYDKEFYSNKSLAIQSEKSTYVLSNTECCLDGTLKFATPLLTTIQHLGPNYQFALIDNTGHWKSSGLKIAMLTAKSHKKKPILQQTLTQQPVSNAVFRNINYLYNPKAPSIEDQLQSLSQLLALEANSKVQPLVEPPLLQYKTHETQPSNNQDAMEKSKPSSHYLDIDDSTSKSIIN